MIETHTVRRRLTGWRAGVIWSVIVVDVVALAVCMVVIPEQPSLPIWALAILTLMVVAYGLVGALVVTREARNPIGWILWGAATAFALSTAGGAYAHFSVDALGGTLPGTVPIAWLQEAGFIPAFATVLVFVPLLFPDGHLLSRRWRWVAWFAGIAIATSAMPELLTPGPLSDYPTVANPVHLPALGSLGDLLSIANSVTIALVFPMAIVSSVLRYRRGSATERQQLKWFAASAGLTITLFMCAATQISPIAEIGWFGGIVTLSLMPIAIGIAILRYRLYEIDRIVSRTLSYAVMTVLLAIVFVAVVLGLTAVLEPVTQESTIAVAGSTLIVATLFQPLRRRVQRVVDRRFNRARYDAQRTMDAFAERLRDEVAISAVTHDLDQTIRSALRPTTLGLWVRGAGE
jgi:hypothetical protein